MKKTASKSRPLSLKRETVRTLDSSQLASAHGGDFDYVRIDLTRDEDRNSGCVVCQLLPPPIGGAASMLPGGCATQTLTGISRVINP